MKKGIRISSNTFKDAGGHVSMMSASRRIANKSSKLCSESHGWEGARNMNNTGWQRRVTSR